MVDRTEGTATDTKRFANKFKTKEQREAHLAVVSDWYRRGKTQQEIAEHTGVSRPLIAYDLKKLQMRWLVEVGRNIREHRAEQMAKIDRLEREYWDAWERSRIQRQDTLTERVDEGAKQKNKAAVRTRHRDGNPEFLVGIQWCIAERNKLLGLYALDQAIVQDTQIRLIGVLMDDI